MAKAKRGQLFLPDRDAGSNAQERWEAVLAELFFSDLRRDRQASWALAHPPREEASPTVRRSE
ncbi:hypothetical protein E8L99_20180 [Phreatobacter aquaticus]|uniref:Uncharacterized protein n=1 Tax=Phreatobacter aquaticus TaxID=2570229 RepID=A0A4D7QQL8_9HYPH|nr:hypothetical protein [Phreatobacter aquaticus]QCK87906.1 hypothetical protein E8L99_20180 [Phreatobacter aquaticus]